MLVYTCSATCRVSRQVSAPRTGESGKRWRKKNEKKKITSNNNWISANSRTVRRKDEMGPNKDTRHFFDSTNTQMRRAILFRKCFFFFPCLHIAMHKTWRLRVKGGQNEKSQKCMQLFTGPVNVSIYVFGFCRNHGRGKRRKQGDEEGKKDAKQARRMRKMREGEV